VSFETNLRRERQLEGIAKAMAAGVYKGRPASIEASRACELKKGGPSIDPHGALCAPSTPLGSGARAADLIRAVCVDIQRRRGSI
jgi:hypothetical protein